MKTLSAIFILLILSFNNQLQAQEPEFQDSLNENIKVHSWKLRSTKAKKIGTRTAELYTLTKNGYILKCVTSYSLYDAETSCYLP